MGALAQAVRTLGTFFPERKTAIAAHIPTWEQGDPQYPHSWHNYYEYALHGYAGSEIAFACIEELATSAAEPRLVAVRKGKDGKPEQLHDHPVLELFERPNPFLSRFQLIAGHIMYRAVAGNAYVELVRSAAGKVVEMWPLRPDRVFVLPSERTHIGGWEYRLGDARYRLPPENVIQSKTRHPLDDWYGLPPLAVCAQRVDTDAFMRGFTLSFFRNAAVPAGLLNVSKQVGAAERQLIQDRFRNETGGPQSWHSLLVLDNTEATYTPMGLSLGQSGIVLPELDEISEARIAMCCMPGTQIITKRGIVPIESVQTGDEVVSHRGRWQHVTQTMCNPVAGRRMVRLKARGFDELCVTADHPVYAARLRQSRTHRGELERFEWIEAGVARPARRNVRGRFDALTVPMLAETDVHTVHVADYISTNRIPFHQEGGQLVSAMPQACPIAADVALTPAMGRLLGYFLAEGSTGRGKVHWYFAAQEIDLQDRVIDDLRLCFGVDAKRVRRGSVTMIVADSALLARFFGQARAHTKRIPSWAWEGDEHFRAGILGAWLDGDGSRDEQGCRGFTASKALAWGMFLLALSLGHVPSIYVNDQNAQPGRSIRGRMVGGRRGYVVRWSHARGRSSSYQVHAHHLTSRVRQSEFFDYDGPVYNLEVEGDHSYLTTGGMVHNCLGVPLELIGARLGMVHGNRSTTLAARGTFWDETLVPLYEELAADFSRGLVPEYDGTPDAFDYLEFDLSTVKALREDDDAKHKRIRDDLASGLLSVQEARTMIGQEPQYEQGALLILNKGLEPMTPQSAEQGAPPYLNAATAPAPTAAEQPTAPQTRERAARERAERPTSGANGNGQGNKPLSREDLAALARLASGKD